MSAEVFDWMIGLTFDKVVEDGRTMKLTASILGQPFVVEFLHYQDCCEDVSIEEVHGDLQDLVGSPIVQAECVSEHNNDEGSSSTWTFYKFATNKGSVVVRWLGSSNGYYSESVDMQINGLDYCDPKEILKEIRDKAILDIAGIE